MDGEHYGAGFTASLETVWQPSERWRTYKGRSSVNMCGSDASSSTTPRVGARVDLFCRRSQSILGNLIFLDPSEPHSQRATHVRFTPHEAVDRSHPLLFSIYSSGDLTRPTDESTLLHRFALPDSWARGEVADVALDKPVSLSIGGEGIIGRRVSMDQARAGGREPLLADGVVGYNSLAMATASL
ncbi:hypothetical protein VTK73DRAFT_8214 [Phialemonium thermophilum]|uniref:Uncharacterized protein n=1 Tax=Phialemonium thermophilum TaxID=223376 RepID=A0ABR3W9X1_9PEZI